MSKLSISKLASAIKKAVGEDAAMVLSSPTGYIANVAYWISTGCPSLDYILGGGIAGGRITELFSYNESEGKTTLAYCLARECQRMGGVVLYIDAEHTADPVYMAKVGVNVTSDGNNFMMSSPDTLEQMFETMEQFIEGVRACQPDIPILVILDSIAAAVPAEQEDASYEKIQMASQARAISPGLRKLNAVVAKYKASILLLNQSRSKVGVMYGDPNVTPGGKAMKFYASQRIALTKKNRITADGKANGPLTGIEVQAYVVKSKVATPFGKALIKLIFGAGFDYWDSLFDLALAKGVLIEETKGVFVHRENPKVKLYRKTFGVTLSSNVELSNKIRSEVAELIHTSHTQAFVSTEEEEEPTDDASE